jgi:hypothetical protein
MVDNPVSTTAANDNDPPTELTILVAATLDDFLAEAEEEGDVPIPPAVGLVELAAVAISKVVLSQGVLPQEIFEMVLGRAATILSERVARWGARCRPPLRSVARNDVSGAP